MALDFTVTVQGPRAADFEAVFGTATVHVRSPIPQLAELPGRGMQYVYLLDLALVTPEQRARLIAHIAARFELPADEVAAELDDHGVPILVSDATCHVSNPHRWF
jgi:hypothetical protein